MSEFEGEINRLRYTAGLLKEDGFGLGGEKINFRNFITLPENEAETLLRSRLRNQISGLTILDKDNSYGVFNRHDSGHLEEVNRIAHALLDDYQILSACPVSLTERNIITTISYLHDLGNNISRHHHGEISVRLFRKIFADFDESDPTVKSILLGIKLHDEPVGINIPDFATLSEQIDIYPKPIWAAIAADKLDVGRHRLSTALRGKLPTTFDQVIEHTPHTLVILYAQKSVYKMKEDGVLAHWDIDFSTDVDTEKREKIKSILEQFIWKGRDMYVPQIWHDSWKHQDIPYSVSYLGNMRMLYCTRMAIMLSCLFALYPQLNTFRINVRDPKTYIQAEVSNIFNRDDWAEVLFMIWKKKNQDLYRQHKIEVPPLLEEGERLYKEKKGYTV